MADIVPSDEPVSPKRLSNRDDFNAATKRLLAERVGYLCSNPACRAMTIGPAMGSNKSVSTGIAAHITAAAPGPGAARYDSSLTPEERSHYDNGIWLCANHAQHIDRDPEQFTTATLKEWKVSAVQFAAELVTSGRGLRDVDVPESLEDVRVIAELAAAAHLRSFKRENWPAHAIQLNLISESGIGGGKAFSVDSLADAVSRLREIKLIAPPGTGKTTTMLQLGDALLAQGSIPLMVQLQDWTNQALGILPWIAQSQAFVDVGLDGLQRLLGEGHVVLLLDGLNEVPTGSRERLISEVAGLRRDFELLMLVVSTRRQASDAEIGRAVVEIQELNEEQQLEIARAANGDAGLEMLDRAWRTPGIRELVSIPLYLQAMLTLAPAGQLPATKDEVVAALIRNHEAEWLRKARIDAHFEGQHSTYLRDLAVIATKAGTVTIPQTEANRSIAITGRELFEEGQIGQVPPPPASVEMLVAIHALKRDGEGHLSFQHHQLQEWYASLYVQSLLLAHTFPRLLLSDGICIDIINERPWEEPLAFACERLSRMDEAGHRAASKVILASLGIDPDLSAALIKRCSQPVWDLVREEVVNFAKAWHTDGKPDHAFTFMVATGRPEFASEVWPLVANVNEQSQSEALYKAGRFTPDALSDRLRTDLAALPEGTRAALLSQFVDAGGYAGIEGAVYWAGCDESSQVKTEVVESLIFRRADRQAVTLLATADEEVWRRIAEKEYADHFADKAVAARLQEYFDESVAQEADPSRKLSRLIAHRKAPDKDAILSALADPALDMHENGVGWSLSSLSEVAPELLGEGLVSRIIAGLNLPYSVESILGGVPTHDDGPIAEIAINELSDRAKAAAMLVGPYTTRAMVDSWLPLDAELTSGGETSKQDSEIAYAKRDVILQVRPEIFISVVLQFHDLTDVTTINSLSDLIARHGPDRPRKQEFKQIDEALRGEVRGLLAKWAEILLATEATSRDQLQDLARAMTVFPDASLFGVTVRMLDEDLRRWREARSKHFSERRAGTIPADVITSYLNVYGGLLLQIGGDDVASYLISKLGDDLFAADAANLLARLHWRGFDEKSEGHFRHWFDFRRADAARKARDANCKEVTREAQAIFTEVERLLALGEDKIGLAITLAGWGGMLPHGDKNELFTRLFTLAKRADTILDLSARMLLGGQRPDHKVLLDGLRRFFPEHEWEKWKLQGEPWEIVRWLEMFAQSDKPESLFDALDIVQQHFKPNFGRMDGIFISLRNTSPEVGPKLLVLLARRYPSVLKEHAWYRALLDFPALSILSALLEIGEHAGKEWDPAHAGYDYAEKVALLVSVSKEALDVLVNAFEKVQSPQLKAFLADVMLYTGVAELFSAAVADPLGRERVGRNLHSVLRAMAYREEAVDQSGRSLRYLPIDIRAIRATLFRSALSDDRAIAGFGRRALRSLESLRRDYGEPDTEPRHPDISLGEPWPILD